MVQAVLTEVRDDYQINEIFLINETLSEQDKTSIADNVNHTPDFNENN